MLMKTRPIPRGWLVIWLLMPPVLGCSGKESLSPVTQVGSMGTADAGTQSADSGGLDEPCSTDSDCGNPFLVCAPVHVYLCLDSSSGDAAPPLHPTQNCPGVPTTERLCTVRYNLPCLIDSDCGPAGFTCNHSVSVCFGSDGGAACGACDGTGGSCSGDSDCPQGWSCYSPCDCPTRPALAKGCYPPFAVFGCPNCPATIIDGGP
jgi:hypothetical protein